MIFIAYHLFANPIYGEKVDQMKIFLQLPINFLEI